MLTLIPLGTSSAVPTRERFLSGTILERSGRLFLFDCGEGTQYRLAQSGLKPSRIDAICISHLHGDHFFGLFGLLSSLAFRGRRSPLTLVGPPGMEAALEAVFGLTGGTPEFEIRHVPVGPSDGAVRVIDAEEVFIETRPLDHRIFTIGYRFQEKDRPGRLDLDRAGALGITEHEAYRRLKEGHDVVRGDGRVVRPEQVLGPKRSGASVAYCFDTRPTEQAVELARGVDLLYHDATFAEAHRDRAMETGHSTAREAALVAREAGARALLLGHFSSRYADVDVLVREAAELFPPVRAAEDLQRYEVGEM